MIRLSSLLFSALLLLLATGCPQKSEVAADSSGGSHGYALLYSVSSQEQNVDKLLWIKKPGPEITKWIQKIATFNKQVTQQLEAWHKDGTVTNLKDTGLPPAEALARKRATSRTTGELLWSTDVDLRVVLVLAQLKALGYCSDLSYAIGEEAGDASIKSTAESWHKQFASLTEEGIAMLEAGLQAEANEQENGDAKKPRPPAYHKQ